MNDASRMAWTPRINDDEAGTLADNGTDYTQIDQPIDAEIVDDTPKPADTETAEEINGNSD